MQSYIAKLKKNTKEIQEKLILAIYFFIQYIKNITYPANKKSASEAMKENFAIF